MAVKLTGPLDYEGSLALMIDQDFRGRVKVACLKFADYILNEASTVTAHNTRMRWAGTCIQGPDMVASQIQPTVVMDPNVQSAGSTIDDATLQTAVETSLNKIIYEPDDTGGWNDDDS